MLLRTGIFSLRPGAALLAVLATLACTCVRAQDADPPGRVAHVSDAEGSVSMQPAGVAEWTAATLNRPLTTGDRIWSDQNSRAELDMGSAVLRLGSSTGFLFFNLDDRTAQMQLTAGTLIVRVRDLQDGQIYEIDTPNLALTLQAPGEYRVEVDEAGDSTVVKVSEGSAEADAGGQTFSIGMQQMASFNGVQTLSYESGTLSTPDDLDAWSAARERGIEDSPSRGYVAEDMPGTQELDNNGVWQSTPEYGYVWAPTVVAIGWAPYRFGHWAWIAPWGWTWIDDARWGFAPSHYGRWVQWNSAWCWVPGPRLVRPVYAPAMVAWVRAPARVVPGGGGPNVAWFPLAPREVYVPAYQVSAGYARSVNVSNTIIIHNTYITNTYQNNVSNVRYVNNTAGAVTAVPEGVFTSGQHVGGQAVRLSTAVLAAAAVTATTPAIVPVRASVLGSAPTRALRPPPAAYLNRPVLVRTPPPRAPVPFDRQVAAIQENGGRALTRADLARLAPPVAAAPVRVLPSPARPVAAGAYGGAATTPGFAQREHALENANLPSMSRPNSYRPPVTPGNAALPAASPPEGMAGPPHIDRPPQGAAPPLYPVTPAVGTQRPGTPNAPPPNSYRAPSLPVPAPAVAAPPVARPQVAAPPPHPAAPAPHDAREGAAHADRDTRDRTQR